MLVIIVSCRRLSFAVCFSRRIDDCSGFAGSSVGFSPFYGFYLKGLKPTEEEALPPGLLIRLLKQTAKERLRHKAQLCLLAHI